MEHVAVQAHHHVTHLQLAALLRRAPRVHAHHAVARKLDAVRGTRRLADRHVDLVAARLKLLPHLHAVVVERDDLGQWHPGEARARHPLAEVLLLAALETHARQRRHLRGKVGARARATATATAKVRVRAKVRARARVRVRGRGRMKVKVGARVTCCVGARLCMRGTSERTRSSTSPSASRRDLAAASAVLQAAPSTETTTSPCNRM